MLAPLLQLMRPGDWFKNVFVLPALIFTLAQNASGSGSATASTADLLGMVAATALAFVAFCLISSGFYCINDALDVEEDRRHPVKASRPVAAGKVSPGAAIVAGMVLIVVSLGLGLLVNLALLSTLALYAGLQALYNVRLKSVMMVDVVAVAIGFGLRAAGGAVALEVQISIWLLLCVFFLCLYLGFVKRLFDLRSAELAGGDTWRPPAGYDDPVELNWLLGISAVLAVVTYLMYALSPHARALFGARAHGLALLTPLVIIAIHRFYRRALAGRSDSPLAALREDRAVLASIVLFVIGTLLTLYVPAVQQALADLFYATGPGAGS